jgi:adenylate cyclase
MLSLMETLFGGKARYFNHYGAAGTISRIPYHELLLPQDGNAKLDLHGQVVLVGFDEDFQSDNIYYSPFTSVSSLELAATAIANLLRHDDIQPFFGRFGQFAWLLCWGSLLGWLSTKKLRVGMAWILLLTIGYLSTAYWLFSGFSLWLPLILPLFLITPLAMIGCLVDNYVMRSRENRKIHSVINRFIPEEATNRNDRPEDDAHWESKVSFGVCLATDAGQYTSLAEKMKPMELGELMNDYYSTLFPIVRQNGGWVSDVTGDAMMAIWTVPISKTDIRLGALRAALEILRAVDHFQEQRQIMLPIRMGLHCGEMRVGFVGGKENAAYRAVGDTVNTSARLEGLNKLLGTRILVSMPLIDGISGFITRPMGRFMLAGKAHPVNVHELVAPAERSEPWLVGMFAHFAEALALFQAGEWQAAANAFAALSREFPDDGPTQFYARTARANASNPLATPDMAAIQVGKPPPGTLALH